VRQTEEQPGVMNEDATIVEYGSGQDSTDPVQVHCPTTTENGAAAVAAAATDLEESNADANGDGGGGEGTSNLDDDDIAPHSDTQLTAV
jgi:hypothetical protein